ncbi:MAG: Maf family nucleotide pyrophosphatase [Candidatus Thiodiazotropha sp. DIVDIV]
MIQAAHLTHLPLILASSSPYRRELLSRLGIEFSTLSPSIDESRQSDESAEDLVVRLSREKAMAVAQSHPEALIIGSDQVATVSGMVLGKPGDHKIAVEQLMSASGQRVTFFTGLTLYNSKSGNTQTSCVPFHVQFRQLNQAEVEHYLEKEKPYNCAGSFKSEGLGISLFERMEGEDPNALIGLPLICLNNMLLQEGVNVLGQN